MIKDSGARTEFETGAVRDIQEDKGRCDLMPLREVSKWLIDYDGIASVLEFLEEFKETGEKFCLYNALTKFVVYSEINEISYILEVSKHFKEGAKKYGENNWQKGIPAHSYLDSAIRHLLKVARGDKDERHDLAFGWNILCLIWTIENKPELNDVVDEDIQEVTE